MTGRVNEHLLVLANDYDLRRNVDRFRAGTYPRHLLWGLPALEEAGWTVTTPGDVGGTWLARHRIARVAMLNVRTARASTRASVTYAASTYGGLLTGWLRPLRRRPGRLITVVHGLPSALTARPRVFALLWRHHDALLFLSPSDLAAVEGHLRPGQHAAWLPWGPSEDEPWDSPLSTPTDPAYALVVGKSKRDWTTLQSARAHDPVPTVVVATEECPLRPADGLVLHLSRRGREAVSLAELRRLYQGAGVVVLPLLEHSSLNGLTVLNEALAARRPVVLSATAAMSGYAARYPGWVTLVPPGDPIALARAVREVLAAPPPSAPLQPPSAEQSERAIFDLVGRPDAPRP